MQPKISFYAALFLFSACGLPDEAEAPLFTPEARDEATLATAKDISIEALYDLSYEKSFSFSEDDLKVKDVVVDSLAMAHVRSKQFFKGVPVFGGESIVHLDPLGKVASITDQLVKEIKPDLSVVPSLSEKAAIRAVLDRYDCERCLTAEPRAELWMMRHQDEDRLVYRVQLERLDGSEETDAPVIFIDAHTGEELLQESNVQTAWGSSLYNGDVEVGTIYYTNLPYQPLVDGNYSNNAFAMEDWYWGIQTVDSSWNWGNFDGDNYWNAAPQKAVVSVQYGAQKTLEYFLNKHGRNGIDNYWGPDSWGSAEDGTTSLLNMGAHYGSNYNNAFWAKVGTKHSPIASFGDGDGSQYGPLVSLDIVGHELTHGVIQYSAGLVYSRESGALNESFADIFGGRVQRYTSGDSAGVWRVAEEEFTPTNGKGDASRYFENPMLNGRPSHFALFASEKVINKDNDYGWVHSNSSIPNHVFSLVAKGGTNILSGGFILFGIGDDAAAAIWYRALTLYLTSTSDFYAARYATIRSAEELYGVGSFQANTVSRAWAASGVGIDPSLNGISGGDLESDGNLWSLAGDAQWWPSFTDARSGVSNFRLGGQNSVSGSVVRSITIPAGLTRSSLSFMMKVKTQETTTTTAYDNLSVQVLNSSNQVLATVATYSNLHTEDGFYRSRGIFNLTPYSGQTIKLRFLVQSDGSLPTTFDIDDISVINSTASQFAVNGGFEAGYLQWVLTNSAYVQSVIFNQPRTGSGNLMLGGCDSCAGNAEQMVNLPTQYGHNLSFWAKVSTSEGPGSVYDRLFVEVTDMNGNVLTSTQLNNTSAAAYTQYQLPINWVGWLKVRFRVQNDYSYPTSFFIDDIQLQ